VTLTTLVSGDVLLGGVSALADLLTVNSIAKINGINGANLSSAGTVDLNAATGIGNTQAVNTAAASISADTTNGNIDINNNLGTAVAATSLTTGTGNIAFDQTGGGSLDVQNAATTAGNIDVSVTGADLKATSVTAGTAAASDGDVSLSTITSGDIKLGNVKALSDTATVTSAGTINDTDAPDDKVANISAGTINLNTGGGDVGTIANYIDLEPSVVWNAKTNGGAAYVRCIGANCALGQVDLGTGTFYHDVIGTLKDGNDGVGVNGFGENLTGPWSGGVWNIKAGGAVLTATNGIGTSANGIEMNLTNYSGAAGDGRLVADGGTSGVFLINKGSGGNGLTIGGIAPLPPSVSASTGVSGQGGITVISGSPFTVGSDVVDSGGGNILLAALGNTAADKLNLNANVTASGGSGNIQLISGDSTAFAAGKTVSAAGSGNVTVAAGEDYTDGILNQDGNTGVGGGSISVADTAAVTSGTGIILLDAADNVNLTGISTGSTATDAVIVNARAGAVTDNGNTTSDIVTGGTGTTTISAVTGIGSGNALETQTGNLSAITDTGSIQIVNTGALNIVTANGVTGVSITDGADANSGALIKVTSTGGMGVNSTVVNHDAGDVTLAALGSTVANDLTVNAGVSTDGGNGNVLLVSGNSTSVTAGNTVSAAGSGNVTVAAGEDYTDGILNQDGNVGAGGGSISIADTAAVTSGTGIILLDAADNVNLTGVSTGSNAANAVIVNARAGAVADNGNTNPDIATGGTGTTTISAVTGIGSGDALETQTGNLAAVTDTGNIQIGNTGNLNLVKANGITGVSITDAANANGGEFIDVRTVGGLTVQKDVMNHAAGDVTLAALGTGAARDLEIRNTVTVASKDGNGNLYLAAGSDLRLLGNAKVTADGAGHITAASGEDLTDNVFDQDGNANGNVRMDTNSALRSSDGNILVDARNNARISEVNANSDGNAVLGDVTIKARRGYVSDRNGAAVNVTGDSLTIEAVKGVGDGSVSDNDILETNVNTLNVTNTTSGAIKIDEVAAGGDLGIDKVDQQLAGDVTVRTLDGTLTVNAGKSGVSATSGTVTLQAQDAGGSGTDDLVVNDTVDTTSGTINLKSDARDVSFGIGGNTTSATTGDVNVTAGRDILMTDGMKVKTGSGLIDFTAGRDIALSSVQTGSNASNAVLLTAAGGASKSTTTAGEIRNVGHTNPNIMTGTTGTATLQATTGIGSSDPLQTQVGKLSAVTDTGNIRIDNTGALEIVNDNGVNGVSILDSGDWNGTNGAFNYITVTTKSPFTVSAAVTNNDGGDITLASLGKLAADDLTVNANIGTNGGNGNVLLTAGDTVTINSGATVSAVGTGTATVASGEDYTDGVLNQDGNTGAAGGDIVMGATGTVQTEHGNILMDAANNFVVGIVNANSTGLGARGDVTTFSRAGSTTDANGPGLNITANTLDMTSAGTIGMPGDPLEVDVNTLLFNSGASSYFAATGSPYVKGTSTSGSIELSATGDINLGFTHAANGYVSLNAGGSINPVEGGTHVIADNLVTLIANNLIGNTSRQLNVNMRNPGTMQISAGGSQNGLSANIGANFGPRSIQFLNLPPGLVLLNGIATGGANMTSLESGMSAVYESPLPYNQPQYGRIDGKYAADFPGFLNQDNFATSPAVPVDTSALDIITVPRIVPPTVVPIPPVAVPTVPAAPPVEEPTKDLKRETPPLVVPIPGEATPTETTGEDKGTR
jgi:hypothetical protein